MIFSRSLLPRLCCCELTDSPVITLYTRRQQRNILDRLFFSDKLKKIMLFGFYFLLKKLFFVITYSFICLYEYPVTMREREREREREEREIFCFYITHAKWNFLNYVEFEKLLGTFWNHDNSLCINWRHYLQMPNPDFG